jgi:hypothetical protein
VESVIHLDCCKVKSTINVDKSLPLNQLAPSVRATLQPNPESITSVRRGDAYVLRRDAPGRDGSHQELSHPTTRDNGGRPTSPFGLTVSFGGTTCLPGTPSVRSHPSANTHPQPPTPIDGPHPPLQLHRPLHYDEGACCILRQPLARPTSPSCCSEGHR